VPIHPPQVPSDAATIGLTGNATAMPVEKVREGAAVAAAQEAASGTGDRP
jgi:hypothetical protein